MGIQGAGATLGSSPFTVYVQMTNRPGIPAGPESQGHAGFEAKTNSNTHACARARTQSHTKNTRPTHMQSASGIREGARTAPSH